VREFWIALVLGLIPAVIRLMLSIYLREWPNVEAVFSDIVTFGLVMSSSYASNISRISRSSGYEHLGLVGSALLLTGMYSISLVPVQQPTNSGPFLFIAMVATSIVVLICWKRAKHYD